MAGDQRTQNRHNRINTLSCPGIRTPQNQEKLLQCEGTQRLQRVVVESPSLAMIRKKLDMVVDNLPSLSYLDHGV